jgi:hypothetical protein
MMDSYLLYYSQLKTVAGRLYHSVNLGCPPGLATAYNSLTFDLISGTTFESAV